MHQLVSFLPKEKGNQRVCNLILQFFLLTYFFSFISSNFWSSIPLAIFVTQIIHYSLIALGDIYIDDYPNKKGIYLVYLGMVSYFIASIVFGFFENDCMRLHTSIVLIGNLVGKKVDSPTWKWLFLIYFSTILFYECWVCDFALIRQGFPILAYIGFSIFIIGLCERISEKNQFIWALHSLLFFTWACINGFYYQEGLLFIIGGASYEITKILGIFTSNSISKKHDLVSYTLKEKRNIILENFLYKNNSIQKRKNGVSSISIEPKLYTTAVDNRPLQTKSVRLFCPQSIN